MSIVWARSIDEKVRLAIANKRLLQLRYGGSLRDVEPHDYGVQKGLERLLVFQLRGPMRSGRPSAREWRLLDLPKIEECTVLDDMFPGSRGDSHKTHMAWDVIYARVG